MKISRIFLGLNALALATAGAIAGALNEDAVNSNCRFNAAGDPILTSPAPGCDTINTGTICKTALGTRIFADNGHLCKKQP